jgi:type 1 fimbria pilin
MSVAVACALPLLSINTYAAAASTVTNFDKPKTCSGGGTRESVGSWDSASGALSFTTTLTNCVEGGTTNNGTVAVSGTLLSTTGGYTLNVTYVYNTHFVNSTDDVVRACTWQKSGTYDNKTHKFQGTIVKSACTLTVVDTEGGEIVEHLQKVTHQTE